MTESNDEPVPARRWSGDWTTEAPPPPPRLEVLIPTIGRTSELAVTLAGLAAQDEPAFDVIVSDQSELFTSASEPSVQAMVRVLRAQGHGVELVHRPERRGLAEQRQFLLERSSAPAVLFLDDDVWTEPGLLERLLDALETLGCGFVGSAVQGLSYLEDRRPHEATTFEPWPGPVIPESVRPGRPEHDRWPLHNAANLAHIAGTLGVERDGWLAYKVAWVGACVLYDREALIEVGGFDFWTGLPPSHSGEDVAAQWRVMERFGGAGIVPSGAVHLEAPTTIVDRTVDAARALFAAAGSAGSSAASSVGSSAGPKGQTDSSSP
ncbi:glycosyltransferase [Labedella populi]|uniref:Glycosyltransferase n=1 Tax=Labedella populi TaxID=2498850 RepID=A0A444QBZ6_9MICO|nr:glycosyltransferase family 2 protein [Labedella populi]RWZ61579.1 glycosyltransferase [Labedella populi]